jgi:hypothetical protein
VVPGLKRKPTGRIAAKRKAGLKRKAAKKAAPKRKVVKRR